MNKEKEGKADITRKVDKENISQNNKENINIKSKLQ